MTPLESSHQWGLEGTSSKPPRAVHTGHASSSPQAPVISLPPSAHFLSLPVV